MKIEILNISWDTMRLQLKAKREKKTIFHAHENGKISIKETHQDIKNTQNPQAEYILLHCYNDF